MVLFNCSFKKISMEGANKHYVDAGGGSVECDMMRIVYDRSQQMEKINNYGSTPSSMSMGRDPKLIRIQVVWNKTPTEMKSYASGLNRNVPCVANIFMPGMIINSISGDPSNAGIGGSWIVDAWTTDRTNSRGKKFTGEVTLIENTL